MPAHQSYSKSIKDIPLHTLLAASTEVLSLQLPVLVVMVMVVMTMASMATGVMEVWVGGPRGAVPVDVPFGRTLVNDVRVVATGGTVVVADGKVLGQRRDKVLLVRRPYQT